MRAVWECHLGNQEPIGFGLDRTFSFAARFTISRKLLNAFETRTIHKLENLQDVTSYSPHQRERCLKYLPGLI